MPFTASLTASDLFGLDIEQQESLRKIFDIVESAAVQGLPAFTVTSTDFFGFDTEQQEALRASLALVYTGGSLASLPTLLDGSFNIQQEQVLVKVLTAFQVAVVAASATVLPTATIFVSSTATNGYALGVNTGPGTSRAAPWLTLDYAISNAPSGSIIEMNDGTYQAATFYNVAGKTLGIRPRVANSVTLTAAASQTRIINCNPSSATLLTLYSIILDGLGNTTRGATLSSAVGISSGMVLNNCTIRNVTQGHVEAGAVEVLNLVINNLRCEGTISNRPVFASFKDGTFIVNGLVAASLVTTANDKALVEALRVIGGGTGQVVRVKGVTGTFTGPAGQATYGIVITCFDGAIIEENNITIQGGVGSSGAIYKIFSNVATMTANNGIVRNNRGSINHDGGYCVLIGSDPSSVANNKHNDPLVENNILTANQAAAQPIHGYMLGWGSGGVVRNNQVTGAGHALLAKDWTGGRFYGNTVTAFTFEGIYAKGAIGTQFDGNTLNLTIPTSQAAIRVDWDDVSTVFSSGVNILGNVVNYQFAGQQIVFVGTGNPTAFSENTYNASSGLPSFPWSYQGTGYATLAAWKAGVEPTAHP